jgi:hypothetical protein
MKSEKESTILKQTISSKGDKNRRVEEALSKVEKIPDIEIPTGKIFLEPDEMSNEEWQKENMETFQLNEGDYTELDKKVDKQMNDDYRNHIQRELFDEIYNEAVNVRLDYEESPSEESGSLVRIHQDSEFLKEK